MSQCPTTLIYRWGTLILYEIVFHTFAVSTKFCTFTAILLGKEILGR